MPTFRTRLSLGLVSFAAVALELALMRALSFRFWHHFAHMTISVALLGFGASGTAISLLRTRVLRNPRAWVCALATAMGPAVLLSVLASRRAPLDVQFLAWDPGEAVNVLVLEALLFVPFILAGGVVGVALLDESKRLPGHYAANLLGSGLGAFGAVALMFLLSTGQLIVAIAWACLLAGLLLTTWRLRRVSLNVLIVACLTGGSWLVLKGQPAISPYKMLPQALAMPGSEVIYRRSGPMGRIDVVSGQAVHYAPALSLQYAQAVPEHVLLILDGDQTSAVYDCHGPEDWAFMDYTTGAVAYRLVSQPSALILGAGGGSDIGLALHHQSSRVVALEMNGQVIDAMTGPLRGRGGRIYEAPGVEVLNAEARHFLAAEVGQFDIIQLPPIDAFGASGAGLYAAQESHLYTVEAFAAMLERLSPRGVLCVTRWARTPPRDALRVLTTLAEALRRQGLDPPRHLAMIRSWATVTILAGRAPIDPAQTDAIRAFCRQRGFDLCHLPDLAACEVNRYHVLQEPDYYRFTKSLLGPGRERFLADYAFDLIPPTDDRPYFFNFLRLRYLPAIKEQLGGLSPAYLELGTLMLLAALGQTVLLAAILIVLPLVPRAPTLREAEGKAAALAYFILLGAGFMFLEMGFLQRLILYLGHPIYSAAAVISSFLVFAGLGSRISQRWQACPRRIIARASGLIVILALAALAGVHLWLPATQAWPTVARFAVAALLMGPLAFVMGQMFPSGLRALAGASPAIVPWAWAVNGFSSVAATISAPLLAMKWGFSRLALIAVGCYALAGLLSHRLPGSSEARLRADG